MTDTQPKTTEVKTIDEKTIAEKTIEGKNVEKLVQRVFELLNPPVATNNTERAELEASESGKSDDTETVRQTNEIRHKSYLELRGKTESIGASARLEMDKSILTLSSAGVALTLGMIDHFHFLLLQALSIIFLFMAAIITVLLSMRVTEQSAEKFVDVIDKAYDVSVAEKVGDLPVEKVIEELDSKTKHLLTNSDVQLERLNKWSLRLFVTAVASLIVFAVMQSSLLNTGDNQKMSSDKQEQTKTTPTSTEEKGQKLPSIPRPMPTPTPSTNPSTKEK